MRQIISYDDITEPYNPPQQLPSSSSAVTGGSSSSKKRKRTQEKQPQTPIKGEDEDSSFEEEEEEMSRELTHDEIWDDSALIRAWDSAIAEYEAYNGPDKGWKEKPIDKSPLWYNVPPPPSKKKKTSHLTEAAVTTNGTDLKEHSGDDSQPINFDTFVPMHDPSLGTTDDTAHHPALPFGAIADPGALAAGITQDEAFSRAMGAMYWTGYWSAIYHIKSQTSTKEIGDTEEGEDIEEDEEDGDFVPSQR